jgi:hypothetical protein
MNPILDEIQQAEAAPITNGKDPVTGRFLSGNKSSVSPGRKAQAYLAHKLEEILPGHTKPANDEMIAWMIELATGCPSLGGNARYKYAKEAIWAYRALAERAYGAPIKDQSELDALAKSGGTVFILAPNVRIDAANVPAELPEAVPDYIDVEPIEP